MRGAALIKACAVFRGLQPLLQCVDPVVILLKIIIGPDIFRKGNGFHGTGLDHVIAPPGNDPDLRGLVIHRKGSGIPDFVGWNCPQKEVILWTVLRLQRDPAGNAYRHRKVLRQLIPAEHRKPGFLSIEQILNVLFMNLLPLRRRILVNLIGVDFFVSLGQRGRPTCLPVSCGFCKPAECPIPVRIGPYPPSPQGTPEWRCRTVSRRRWP